MDAKFSSSANWNITLYICGRLIMEINEGININSSCEETSSPAKLLFLHQAAKSLMSVNEKKWCFRSVLLKCR
jgi:hypothetical protein